MLALLLVQTTLAGDGAWCAAPFGIGLYVHGKPVRGVAYTTTQVLGFGAGIAGSALMADAVDAGNGDGALAWQATATSGVILGALSYVVSIVDGARVHQLETERTSRIEALDLWRRGLAAAPREQ